MEWRKTLFTALIRLHRFLQRLLGAATVGVRVLVMNSKQEVLLVEHTYIEGWHFPGGGVGHMEPLVDAAQRELAEEACLQAEKLNLFDIYVHNVRGISDHVALFIVTEFAEIPSQKPCAEIKNAQWFSITNLPEGTTQSTRRRIAEYLGQSEVSKIW